MSNIVMCYYLDPYGNSIAAFRWAGFTHVQTVLPEDPHKFRGPHSNKIFWFFLTFFTDQCPSRR